jgi:hypothetical protein
VTKLRWDKAGERIRDPGAIVEVPDITQPWTPPQDRKRRAEIRTKKNQEFRERSLARDRKLSKPGAIAAILDNKREPQPSGINALIARVSSKPKPKRYRSKKRKAR